MRQDIDTIAVKPKKPLAAPRPPPNVFAQLYRNKQEKEENLAKVAEAEVVEEEMESVFEEDVEEFEEETPDVKVLAQEMKSKIKEIQTTK